MSDVREAVRKLQTVVYVLVALGVLVLLVECRDLVVADRRAARELSASGPLTK